MRERERERHTHREREREERNVLTHRGLGPGGVGVPDGITNPDRAGRVGTEHQVKLSVAMVSALVPLGAWRNLSQNGSGLYIYINIYTYIHIT